MTRRRQAANKKAIYKNKKSKKSKQSKKISDIKNNAKTN